MVRHARRQSNPGPRRQPENEASGPNASGPNASGPNASGPNASGTAAAEDVARFSALAEAWWDEEGAFAPLHQINPLRIAFIRNGLCAHFGLDAKAQAPLTGLSLLDIGCGGGLLTEPMARLGAAVRGIDASERNIQIAAAHARDLDLAIDYRCQLPEELAGERKNYDVVLNMEVVEHVADLGAYMDAAASLVAAGGASVIATLNRTLKSLALAKIGAEYLLRWLPPGTHDWRKFVKPQELAAHLARAGFHIQELKGMAYNPLLGEWRLSDDLGVNYLVFAKRQ